MRRPRRRVRWVGFLVLATFALPGAATAARSIEEAPIPDRLGPPEGVEPLLVEDFDGNSLDRETWGTCHWWAPEGGCTIASNDELEWYVDDAVSVADGHVRLTATPESIEVEDGTFPYRSGMISSGPESSEDDVDARFSFTYGYLEARIRVPEGTGLWPAFWLLPADRESRPEIDVLETLGDTPDLARMHYHWVDPAGDRQSIGRDVDTPGLSDDWHVFSVDWRPGSLTWGIDGEPVWKLEGPSVSAEPMYVVLNLAVGGEWPGAPDENTEFPASVEADWIKVWPQP